MIALLHAAQKKAYFIREIDIEHRDWSGTKEKLVRRSIFCMDSTLTIASPSGFNWTGYCFSRLNLIVLGKKFHNI